MVLADFGAEVIRIDRLDSGPAEVAIDPRCNFLARGRASLALDLKKPQATEIVLRLVADADALIEGLRPGVMERLGLGPEPCLGRNPRLVYGRMTGWGQDGPLAQRAGHDINYISLNGVLHAIGSPSGPPVPPVNLVGDYGGGAMFLVAGLLAALLESRSSGAGQVVDANMLEGSSYLMTTLHMFRAAGQWRPDRGSNLLDGGAPFYRVYETADRRYMAVGAIEPKFYREFVAGLGLDLAQLPDPANPAHWASLVETFAAAFRGRTREDWTAIFAGRDACVTPVLSMEESMAHDHNRQRGNFLADGEGRYPNATPRFSRTPADAGRPIAPEGAHGRDILARVGFTEPEIADLVRRGIVRVPEA
jgi:alpha-methylacyl-CoA racemase